MAMIKSKKEFFDYAQTVFLLVGMIIGAGVFAVPSALARVGVILGTFLFLIISLAVLLTHVFYAEVVGICGLQRRFIYDVARLLGRRFRLAAILITISQYGALFAYMLLGGIFIQNLLGGFLPNFSLGGFQLTFFFVTAFLALFGDEVMAKANWYATWGLLAVFVGIILLSSSALNPQNLLTASFSDFFTPFGVFLFSLLGINAIPEMWQKSQRAGTGSVRQAVIGGTVIAVLATYFFGLSVVGVTGPYTTPDAIKGLAVIFGPKLLLAGSLAGFLAVFTSFVVMAMNLRETWRFDFKMKTGTSALTTLLPVFGLWLFLPRDFVRVISVTGSIFGGLAGILIALMYAKLLQKSPTEIKFFRLPAVLPMLVALVFFIGMAAEIIQFFR